MTGLGAVTVTLTGSKHDTFVTNSNGEYFFAQLITGGDYTVTPSKGDLTFTPSRRRFTDLAADQPDVDFRTRSASVTGRVTIGTAGGEGLGGVTMRLTGGTNFAPREVKSSSTGAYTFGQVPTPGSYKVTPSKVGYRFGPEQAALINLTTSRTGVDFTASLKTYTVSGVVKSGASGLGGVTVKLESPTPGGFTARGTTTNSAGAYSFPNVLAGRSYTVTPVKAGYQFTPVGASLADLSADHTNVNFAVKVYSITGRVVRAGTSTGIGAVTLTLTSPTPGNFAARTAQTSSTGYYTFTNLPAGRSYTLKPAKSGFTFSPATRGLTNLSANVPAGTSTSFTGAGP